jgi:hypothetical protein
MAPHRRDAAARPLGQDLIIPFLALGLTAYYFWTVRELAWEAKASGIVIGIILLVLVALLLVRVAVQLARGEATLGITLGGDAATDRMRLGLLGLGVAFVLALPVLGTCISLALMLFAAMWMLGRPALAEPDRRVAGHAACGLGRR